MPQARKGRSVPTAATWPPRAHCVLDRAHPTFTAAVRKYRLLAAALPLAAPFGLHVLRCYPRSDALAYHRLRHRTIGTRASGRLSLRRIPMPVVATTVSPAILMPPRRPTSPSPSPPPPPPSTPPSPSPSPLKAVACGGRLAHRASPAACTTSAQTAGEPPPRRARTARTCTRAAAPPPAPIPPVLRFHRLRDRSRGGTHIRQQHTRNRGATARRMHRRPWHAICARCRHACGRSLVVVCTQYGVHTIVVRMSPL